MKDIIRKELNEAQSVLEKFFIDENINKIESAANIFKTTISQGNKIISCGNGGSMCDAMHFAEELTGKFRDCLLYTSPSPRDKRQSRMPSSA